MSGKVWHKIKIGLLVIGLGLILFSGFKEHQKKLRLVPTQAELESVLPGSLVKGRKEKPIPHYPGKIVVEGRARPAAALLTAELPPEFKGFTDQINILFSIDQDGNLLKLRVISERETPYYFRLIRSAGFFEKISGKNFRELSRVKVVSGASISSKAILDDLKAGANLAMREIFQREVSEEKATALTDIYLQPRIIVLMIILLLGWAVRYFRNRWTRWLVFGLSIIGIGFWLKTPFALPHLFQILSGQIPFRSNPYLAVLGGFVILTTIGFGPLWCAYLCPYAGIQELASAFGKNYRWHPSRNALTLARQLRWLVLFITVLLYFGLRIRSGSEIEPFFHLFSGQWTFAGITLVLLTLVGSFFLPRFWCRFFCPTGACLILLSSHRKFFRGIEEGIKASEIDASASPEKSEPD